MAHAIVPTMLNVKLKYHAIDLPEMVLMKAQDFEYLRRLVRSGGLDRVPAHLPDGTPKSISSRTVESVRRID